MFESLNHQHHSEVWLFPSTEERNGFQCVACLVDILGDNNVSRVQREVALAVLLCMVERNEDVSETLLEDFDKYLGLCNLIFDVYTFEPFKKSAVPLCVNLIYKFQNGMAFQALMEKVKGIIYGSLSHLDIHFYFIVLHQLFEKSSEYIKMLCFDEDSVLEDIIRNKDHFDQRTVIELANMLKYVVRVLLETLPVHDQVGNLLMQEIMETVKSWLGASTQHDLCVACLALLLESVKSPVLVTEMLLRGEKESSVLLMGLKRLLATKNEALILLGTQCLTRLVQNISEPWHIKLILDTDLAELIFEFLHTSNIFQLSCMFDCLHTMAGHQLFFDKCHAVYGLEATLSAIKIALDTRKNTVLEKGLAFLTCLLDRQPENMPLFLNQSWSTCASLLSDLLQNEYQNMIPRTLSTVEAFFRPKHQQNLTDVKAIIQILKNIMGTTKYYLQVLCQGRGEDTSFSILMSLFATVFSMNKLMLSDRIMCGNESSSLDELHLCLKSLCVDFLHPWTVGSWHHFSEEDLVQALFTFLDIEIGIADNDDELMQIVPMTLFHQGLILLSQPYISKDVQNKGLQSLVFVLFKYADRVKPKMHMNEATVLRGLSKLQWHLSPSLDFFVEEMNCPEERGALFCLIYFSLLHGYSIFDSESLLQFVKTVIRMCPNICSDDPYIVRSCVYILSICQANSLEAADETVFEDSSAQFITDLEQLPVETWYTAGPAVFHWALLTSEKVERIGKQMVEYWLVHLNHPSTQDIHLEDLIDQDMAILATMASQNNFLHCLMDLLHSKREGPKAISVLRFCIVQLSDFRTWEIGPSVLNGLLLTGIQRFDSLFVQSSELDYVMASNLMHVLCTLLESPIGACMKDQPISYFKSVYNVVKLISKCEEEESTAAALQYFAAVVKGLTVQESQTIIPVVLQSEKCISFLEITFESPSSRVFWHCLAVVSWLAANGQCCEAERFVTVKSHLLLKYLAICSRSCSKLIIQLLQSALLAMANRRTMFGACHFFRECQAFIPSKIFTLLELRQIYDFLQQQVCQEDSSLRYKAMECIENLVYVGPDIEKYVIQHPWNLALFESLFSRVDNGLQENDLIFCSLYSSRNPLQVWNSSSVNNFFMAILNTPLSPQQQKLAATLFRQIKSVDVNVDRDLMETVEAFLDTCDDCFQTF